MRAWILGGGVLLLLCGMLLATLSGCGHDPIHGIDMAEARKAADRVHKPAKPGEKIIPGHGG